MAKGKQPSKPSTSLFQGIFRFFRKGKQAIERWLQSWLIKVKRRSQTTQAGFVLPTVTMVLLVVVLLTFAISFRAFERSKIAQYRRVDEAVLQAATPALDRARSKIDYLLQEDKTLPRATPSDDELYRALTDDFYTLSDETQLRIATTDGDQPQDDFIDTAWRFPVDTNNDGDIDSYTLYGIYFLVPKIAADEDERARTAIEARTPPMQSVRTLRDECAIAGTSADLIDGSGWVKQDGKLRKSFFVYAVTVPIESNNSGGYSALEYQQDRTRIPLTNNAVIYEDDLEITPGDEFRLNGRIITNSNLITSRFPAGELRYYLVSSTNSCFYEVENSKIIVAGNVINGMSGNEQGRNIIAIPVDLFEEGGAPGQEDIAENSQSITEGAYEGLYDSQAYEAIIRELVLAQIAGGGDPAVVQETIARRLEDDDTLDPDEVRQEELDAYFRARTRKVPFADRDDGTAYANSISFGGAGDELRPTDEWTNPENSDLNLVAGQLLADNPANFEDNEPHLGNRILVGNNQPALEFEDGEFREATFTLGQWDDDGTDRERPTQIQELPDLGETDRHGFWEKAAAEAPDPILEGTGGLRVITGAGVYERESSFLPPPPAAPPVVAGEANPFTVVWPDSMPMSPSEGEQVYDNTGGNWEPLPTTLPPAPAGSIDPSTPKYAKGDLRMRATAVYHYAQDTFDDDSEQMPIACVSSYYDPTNEDTAKNQDGLGWEDDPLGKSNNGIVYAANITRPGTLTQNAVGLFTGTTDLEQQANMVFPDGRFANELLREALQSGNRNLAEQAAIDSTLCAIGILDGSLSRSTTFIPDGAIYEKAFLNAREAKAIEQDNDATDDVDETFTLQPDGELTDLYNLPLEDRHPLEIRATVLDVDLLRNQEIGFSGVTGPSPEYLLPNSGIIYASRDDALPDRSETEEDTTEALSPTDFKLDPTRRPNGILLINGKYLARNDANDDGQNDSGLSGDIREAVQQIVQEKGLTLVSNLPTYIKGEFNLHSKEEFRGADELDEDWGNFYDRGADVNDFDPDFACRPGDPRLENCTEGDTWRPATVLADSVTLLSDNFEFGYRNHGDFDLRNNAGVVATPDGYDLNGNGTIDATANINETNFSVVGTLLTNLRFDLNKDGTIGDTISESNIEAIPAKLARQRNGFNAYNNFVTNGLSSAGIDTNVTDEDYVNDTNDVVDSSYFNNFVTPIQRRGDFPEYVMEICRKLPVSACEPDDWVVGYDGNPNIKMADLPNTLNGLPTAIDAFNSGSFDPSLLMAGTTAQPALEEEDRRFPRRIAFLRDATSDDQLILNSSLPIPLGISGTDNSATSAGALECYLYQGTYNWDWDNSPGSDHGCVLYTSDRPRLQENTLWFRTTENSGNPSTTAEGDWNYGYNFPLWYANNLTGNTVEQPILVPVLQIHATDTEPQANVANLPQGEQANIETSWLVRMPSVTTVEYNLVVGAGDVPSRPGEFNGGLQNLARTLENWNGVVDPGNDSDTSTIKIQGSFVQLRRSRYSSAPYTSAQGNPGIFGTNATDNNKYNRYNIQNAGGRIGYFTPPKRQWGFDVGLLSQPPDLFAQKFSTPPSVPSPDEYFREVSRDDEWVQALLCAQTLDDENAVPERIRPDNCPN